MQNPERKTVSRAVAAEMLGLAPGTLRNWANRKPPRGPRPTKTGTTRQARIIYDLTEIEKWKRDPVAYELRDSKRNRARHR